MSRAIYMKLIMCITVIFVAVSSFAQNIEFENLDCGSLMAASASCTNGATAFPIVVSGLPNLGTNNTGIVDVYIDIDQPNGFEARVVLEAPDGSQFIMATSNDFNPSFPDYPGGSLPMAVHFRNCANLTATPDVIGNPNGGTYFPMEDFSGLNNSGMDPNGTWLMKFCGFSDPINVFCTRITFGPLCPTIDTVNITPPTCPGFNDGSVEIVVTEGACQTYYSINGVDFDTSSIFNNVGEGILIGSAVDENSLVSYTGGASNRSSSSTQVICQDDITINVQANDDEPPMIFDCPSDMTINVDNTCSFNFSITEPTYLDNCGIASADVTITDNFGNVSIFPIDPGVTFSYPGAGTGNYNFNWEVIDQSGLATTCQTNIIIQDVEPPQWTGAVFIALQGECGVDDPVALRQSVENQITSSDNCDPAPTISLVQTNISSICGNSEEFQYLYQISDVDGNTNSFLAEILVSMTDNTNPVITGVPADVTIDCDDSFPVMPTVTAMDLCAGDLTASIDTSFSVIISSCGADSVAAIYTYFWTVLDGCGNGAFADWTVTVLNSQSVNLGDDIEACQGDIVELSVAGLTGSFLWSTGETTSTIEVTSSDVYGVTVTGMNGCCTTDEVAVNFNDNPVATAIGGTLDCSGTAVTLMGSSSISGVTYSWSGPGGYTSNEQNPSVSQAGSYVLLVTTTDGCSDIDSTDVDSDSEVPTLTTSGDTLDCGNTTAMISANSTTAGVTYNWVGPNGYTSSAMTNQVSDPGIYAVTVTAPNLCIAEGFALIVADTITPSIQVGNATITCTQSIITLDPNVSDSTATFLWNGPDGFVSNLLNPEITVPGTYTVVMTSANQCQSNATAVVAIDTAQPDITATGGTIDCAHDSIQLMTSSTSSNLTYQWSGPNGYSNNSPNPFVAVAGNYTVMVTGQNGCSNTAQVEVLSDLVTPDLMATGGTLTCDQAFLMLQASSNTANVSYAWSGPDSFQTSEQNPTISTPGSYDVVVTAPNGCTAATTVQVDIDTIAPNLSANGDTLSCDSTSLTLNASSTTLGVNYSWSGPDSFQSTSINPIVTLPGMYTVIATAPNGCQSEVTVEVYADNSVPDLMATGGRLTCLVNEVQLQASSSVDSLSYHWSGPSGFMSTEANPTVAFGGNYTIVITAPNGCSNAMSVPVLVDTLSPAVTIEQIDIDCDQYVIEIEASSVDSNLSYTWRYNGSIISEDSSVLISNAGDYELSVTGSNGCMSSASYVLADTFQALQTNITSMAATDTTLGTAMIEILNSDSITSITWDNGDTGNSATELSPGDHTVVVVDNFGCEHEFEFNIELFSSTNTLNNSSSWKIYPTISEFSVVLDIEFNAPVDALLSIYSAEGRVMRQDEILNTSTIEEELDISDFPTGLYFITISVGDQFRTQKIIKF